MSTAAVADTVVVATQPLAEPPSGRSRSSGE